jgi:hypothetical protein
VIACGALVRRTWLAALIAVVLTAASVQSKAQVATVRDVGPGIAGRALRAALNAPHRLFPPSPGQLVLSRDSSYDITVIVLDRTTVVEGHIRGDVIVVGGDMFIHPGAQIDGRAIAIGGAVYPSMLALVRGSVESYRDFTFDVVQTEGVYVLTYRALLGYPSPPVTLPGLFGLRLPLYERSDGLSLPVAPLIAFDSSRIVIEPTLTYRSNLGKIDPSVDANLQMGRRLRARALVGRVTSTNDAWIWSDLINSGAVILKGLDTRNYFRADRADLSLHRLWELRTITLEPFIGGRWERGWSVGPTPLSTHAPWTLLHRHDRENILRPNPAIDDGHISSLLLGTSLAWESQGVRLTTTLTGEGAFAAPRDQRFTQGVLDGTLSFPTFAGQVYVFDAHVVATAAPDSAPRQRWGWLGGTGTFPMLSLLSLGGDEVLFLESDYVIPIRGVDLRFVGTPIVTLRYMIGSAGVQRLPTLEQNLALALAVSYLRFELRVDPARHKSNFGVGLSVTR